MRARAIPKPRPVRGLDLLAKVAASALPVLSAPIDQLRHDTRRVLDQTSGHKEPPYADRATAPRPLTPLAEVSVVSALLPGALGDRLRQLGRDLDMVRQRLRGNPPPVVVDRPRRARLAPAPAPPKAITSRPVTVTGVVRETADAISLTLTEADGSPFEFVAGQFLSFDVEVDGEVHRRAYSLATPPLAGRPAHVTIKRVAGGRVSNHLNDHAEIGMTLNVLGPSGAFTMEPASCAERLVLIAGGSGITPIASIAEMALEAAPSSRVTLLYGNRSEADVIFRERFDALAATHPGRFTLEHVLESPSSDWTGTRGRLDGATALARLGAHGHSDDGRCAYYVCGPSGMMDSVREALLASGVEASRIHEERFSRPEERRGPEESFGAQTVTLKTGGRSLEVLTDGETLLEAGLAAGLDMPFSCAMGGCAACKVKVTSGQVVMEEPNCLTQAERDAGYVLACVGRAASPCTVEVEQ